MHSEYHSYYNWRILGYVDLTFCAIIVISNALVILVLTRNKISPLNMIFIHIAITESLTVLAYVPRAWQELIRVTLCSISEHRTRDWEKISINSCVATYLFRAIAAWLAVMLAVWRYLAVSRPLKARIWCNMRSTHTFIVTGYIFSLIIIIPAYFSVDAGKTVILLDEEGCFTTNSSIGHNATIYEFKVPLENNIFWYTVTALSYGIFIKTLPPLIVAVIVYKLIVALFEMKKSNEEMTLNSHHYYSTTLILVIVCLLFVIAEVPHGIFALLSGIYGPDFFWKHYFNSMEMINSLMHFSMCFNFIIYYAMSSQFRQTFNKLFIHNTLNTAPVKQDVLLSNTVKSFRTINQSSNFKDININTAQVDEANVS